LNISYDIILVCHNQVVRLNHESKRMFDVDFLNWELDNTNCVDKEVGNYTIVLERKIYFSTSSDEVLSSTFEKVICPKKYMISPEAHVDS
jgi:hypothetical protein